jgi:hypothetical protein
MTAKCKYRITVQGSLDHGWSNWLNGLTVAIDENTSGKMITTITGKITDQAQLRGILTRLWDLNLALISVVQIDNE